MTRSGWPRASVDRYITAVDFTAVLSPKFVSYVWRMSPLALPLGSVWRRTSRRAPDTPRVRWHGRQDDHGRSDACRSLLTCMTSLSSG